METLSAAVAFVDGLLKWPLIIGLISTGVFLTLRLGFIQFRRFGHGVAVTTGKYDDPNEPGDVSHFQALATALSATVGVGNIAGVAMAIYYGGPGALFWMWIIAILGMCTKYSEVTLALHYRQLLKPDRDGKVWEGSVAGGPMYYIDKGLGWKPVAVFFAFALMVCSFFTGNAIQANTIASQMFTNFGIPPWMTGLATATLVGAVIIGGIRRIGAVAGILAPLMAGIYVLGALLVLALNVGEVPHAFALIFTEAFNPTSSLAGTGAGLFLLTMEFGVRRGLFSNEAGQGSAPIAHSAAKTDEPVSEGVVALLEPFIDTIIICTLTGLVVITTGVYKERFETTLSLSDANVSLVTSGHRTGDAAAEDQATPLTLVNGQAVDGAGRMLGYFGIHVQELYTDEAQTQPFTGTLDLGTDRAVGADGTIYAQLYGDGVRTGAPLTTMAFQQGLHPVGLDGLGTLIVVVCVFLFAISTAISWSYYGDRCATYLFGTQAILPYKLVFVVLHFVGATLAVTTIWDMGDVALALATLPNILALVFLSGKLKTLTNSYFERKPWIENEEVHKRIVAEKHPK